MLQNHALLGYLHKHGSSIISGAQVYLFAVHLSEHTQIVVLDSVEFVVADALQVSACEAQRMFRDFGAGSVGPSH